MVFTMMCVFTIFCFFFFYVSQFFYQKTGFNVIGTSSRIDFPCSFLNNEEKQEYSRDKCVSVTFNFFFFCNSVENNRRELKYSPNNIYYLVLISNRSTIFRICWCFFKLLKTISNFRVF